MAHIVEHLSLPMAEVDFADDYANQTEVIYYRGGLRYVIQKKEGEKKCPLEITSGNTARPSA